MVVIALNAGDQIEIVDPEGLQCVHIVAFNASGNFSSGQFTPDQMTNGVKLASMLEHESPGATKIKQKLKLFGIDSFICTNCCTTGRAEQPRFKGQPSRLKQSVLEFSAHPVVQ